ncbi:hypothetical protein NE237_028826 [Protea cynaroides]|uniref:3'-5' exonuclease domain-containing protein n=1 Tax=Protea cynaroides TaxID=273540 RepID=A0A9Q0JT87_9MAGN|nr:hypothetical protein NE237_028826 [Protea cynaroides]
MLIPVPGSRSSFVSLSRFPHSVPTSLWSLIHSPLKPESSETMKRITMSTYSCEASQTKKRITISTNSYEPSETKKRIIISTNSNEPPSHEYKVNFLEDNILCTVTRTCSVVSQWLTSIQTIHDHCMTNLIVGLDIEWRPKFRPGAKNPVAILQLCVDGRCLIFQIMHCDHVPPSLITFLNNQNYTFVGVEINSDVNSLIHDYGLSVSCTKDLRFLAAEKLEREELQRAGLKTLALVVLGKELKKPRNITLSKWDDLQLSNDQVCYACIDAFVSFEIGRYLISGSY